MALSQGGSPPPSRGSPRRARGPPGWPMAGDKQRADSVYLFHQKGAEGTLLPRYLLHMNSLRHGGPVSCVDPAAQQVCRAPQVTRRPGSAPRSARPGREGAPDSASSPALHLPASQPAAHLPTSSPAAHLSASYAAPHLPWLLRNGGLRAGVGCTLSALCHRPPGAPIGSGLDALGPPIHFRSQSAVWGTSLVA